MTPNSRHDKRETKAELLCALLQLLLKCFLCWMAGGRMLREKRITAVNQGNADSFQSSASHKQLGFISCLTGGFSQMITSFTCKEKLSKLKVLLISSNRASGGAALSSFIYWLHAFIVTVTTLEGSIESLSWDIHLFWNRWRCGKPASSKCDLSDLLWDCLAHGSSDTGDSRKGHKLALRDVMRETWAVIASYPELAFSWRAPSQCMILHFASSPLSETVRHSLGCIIIFPCLYGCCPTFQTSHITWLVLVQSACADTVIGLNKKTQNRPQPVSPGPLLFLLLPCLKLQLWFNAGSQSYSVNMSCWYSRGKGQPTRERNTNSSPTAEPIAYECLIYLLHFCRRDESAA